MAWIWTLVACAAFPEAGGAPPVEVREAAAAGAPAAAGASASAGAPGAAGAPAPAAGGLQGPAMQADLHLDTPTQLHRRSVGFDATGLEAGLAQLRRGGTNLAVEVLWPPREADWPAHVEALLTRLEAEDARLEELTLVRSPAEARRVAARGGVAFAVSLEGAHGLGDVPFEPGGRAALGALHRRGLSLLGLTWSFSNRYAGSSGDGGGGLTEEGKALVAEANRLGVVLDLSHASRATTLDTCRLSTAPLIASHSDAAAVRAHPRNLTDEEIDCIAASGGVIGLNVHATFVGSPAGVKKLADHADHLRERGGVGVVALGSDFDGLITTPPDLPDAGAVPALWAELRSRGWTEGEIEAVKAGNFLRAWQAVIDRAATPPTP